MVDKAGQRSFHGDQKSPPVIQLSDNDPIDNVEQTIFSMTTATLKNAVAILAVKNLSEEEYHKSIKLIDQLPSMATFENHTDTIVRRGTVKRYMIALMEELIKVLKESIQ